MIEKVFKIYKKGHITKQEIIEQLKKQGVNKISSRRINYYIDMGLIPKGIKEFIPGLAGSVSFFKENTPLLIIKIEELHKHYGLTFKEISKYKNWELGQYEIFKDENGKPKMLTTMEAAKLQTVKDILSEV